MNKIVTSERSSQCVIALLHIPLFDFAPEEAFDRFMPNVDGVALQGGRRRNQVARIFAIGHQHLKSIALFGAMQAAEKEMRPVKTAVARAIHIALRYQFLIDGFGFKRVARA